MLLMLRAWPVKTFASWVGGTFWGRCDQFGDPEVKGKRGRTDVGSPRCPGQRTLGNMGELGWGMLMKRRVRGGCNHNHSDVEGVPKEDGTEPA